MYLALSWIISLLAILHVSQGIKVLEVNFQSPPTSFETKFPAKYQENNLVEAEPATLDALRKSALQLLSERLQTDLSEMQVKTS